MLSRVGELAPRGLGASTSALVVAAIKPLTEAGGGRRFADLVAEAAEGDDPGSPGGVGAGDIGPPDYFISHAWGRPFDELCQLVIGHLALAADSTRVWLDIFAINQHHADAKELGQFAVAIGKASATLVCLDGAATPLTRIWCLHELDHTLRSGRGSSDKLVFVHGEDLGQEQMAQVGAGGGGGTLMILQW